MATNMGRGIMAPDSADSISSSGVQEMRTLAATAAMAIGDTEEALTVMVTESTTAENPNRALTATSSFNANMLTAHSFVLVGPAGLSGTHNLPVNEPGWLNHVENSSQWKHQTYATRTTGESWERSMNSGVWNPWVKLARAADVTATARSENPYRANLIDPNFHADNLGVASERFSIMLVGPSALTGGNNGLPVQEPGWLHNIEQGSQWKHQRYFTRETGESWERFMNSGTWDEWRRTGSSGGIGAGGSGGTATTEMESTGRWTTRSAEESYLDSLAEHEYITKFEIGRSVENRPIWALQVGPFEPEYPHQKRAVLFTAGMHGNEPGPREGALQWVRELINPTSITYDPNHMIAVIVPTVNPDRILGTRNNANDINLNRDFVDYSQPESQAIRNLMQSADYDFIAYIDGHNGGYSDAVSTRWGDQDPVATTLVKQLGETLHDQIAEAYERRNMPWRMYGEPGLEGIPGDGTLVDGAFMRFGGQFGVPSVLVEVPRAYRSLPSWQAEITKEAFRAVWEHVSANRSEFKAAKTAAGF